MALKSIVNSFQGQENKTQVIYRKQTKIQFKYLFDHIY